jgi:hypothetical protein
MSIAGSKIIKAEYRNKGIPEILLWIEHPTGISEGITIAPKDSCSKVYTGTLSDITRLVGTTILTSKVEESLTENINKTITHRFKWSVSCLTNLRLSEHTFEWRCTDKR